jgi:hypothetical protein
VKITGRRSEPSCNLQLATYTTLLRWLRDGQAACCAGSSLSGVHVHEARGRDQTHNEAYLFVRHPFHCAQVLCTCIRRTAAPAQVQGVRRVDDTPTHTVPATCREIQTQVKLGSGG